MPRERQGHIFCCCAIPLLNTGIYLALLEQLAAGILIGTLILAAPPIVGVSIPTFTAYILAGLLYLTSLCQILGFFGVARESTKLFRTYLWLNSILVVACFALAAALIGISASKHNTVVSACEASFFPASTGTSSVGSGALDGEGQSVCNIFAWVDIGVLGGLWLLLAIFQGYLLIINSLYSRDQRADHKRYASIYSTQEDILLSERLGQNPWDTRASFDNSRDLLAEPDGPPAGAAGLGAGNQYDYVPAHARTGSELSETSTVRGEPFVPPTSPPRGGFGGGYGDEAFFPPQGAGQPRIASGEEPAPGYQGEQRYERQ